MYVRPVGDAVRVCVFEITVVCLRSWSSPELMFGFKFWLKICLSGPNSVNAFVNCRRFYFIPVDVIISSKLFFSFPRKSCNKEEILSASHEFTDISIDFEYSKRLSRVIGGGNFLYNSDSSSFDVDIPCFG